ncbi:MAG: serine hydrolase, partial [Gammaproteobacteria bacterium]|nr:serine hydrolase [Gammaproteobacteria bacterium]
MLYAIASMTKPIVSLATLILADRGVLNLDDAVQTFIPEFADLM